MDRKHRFYYVKYNEITFEISGDWEEHQPATEHEPAEGGCFYEYKITTDEGDFTELLNEETKHHLVTKAEEGLRAL